MNSQPDIVFERRGAAGIVTLNRPQALNAITHAMVRALVAQLAAWAHDPAVTRVVVHAPGARAFCAGGDLRDIYENGRAGRQADSLQYWRDEYRLNALIKHYPKPYVALIDGIVMGGGVGISVHGSHRVAGERYLFAMPEDGIGFFPDVGATWFLPRLAGELGTYVALTGERLKAADGVVTGLATHYVPSARFADLIEGLCGTFSVDALLAAFAEAPEQGPVTARRAAIDGTFAADDVEGILAALDRDAASGGPDADWAAATAATIRAKAPLGLKIALSQMRRGKLLAFDECIRTEFRIVSRVVYGQDFYEGVRAVIIEKDNAPHWRPASLAAVTAAEVERHFAPLDADELVLP